MEELNRLKSGGLEFAKSFAAIRAAAATSPYVMYSPFAAASAVPWNQARRQINRHLDDLCRWAHAKGWPLITSIVVEQENRKTGELGEPALLGFLKSAANCGLVVGNKDREFLMDQQKRTFDWAAAEECA
jgi:5-methylcytosine-specific restriction protein B